MACKIRIDPYNKEAGKRRYVLITQDAASLEARVATADTALNDDGIDPVLSKVYERGSEYGEDLHSVTSWNTFAKSVDLQINEVVDEDSGTTYLVLDEQDIVIKRGGVQGIVKGAGLISVNLIFFNSIQFISLHFFIIYLLPIKLFLILL